jgi:hypothetical protein
VFVRSTATPPAVEIGADAQTASLGRLQEQLPKNQNQEKYARKSMAGK